MGRGSRSERAGVIPICRSQSICRSQPIVIVTLAVALLIAIVSIVPIPASGSASGGLPIGIVSVGLDSFFESGPLPDFDPFLVSHLIGYATLAVCCSRVIPVVDSGRVFAASSRVRIGSWTHSRLAVGVAAVVIATSYGAAIEIVQLPIPWRSGGIADAGINLCGAIGGVSIDAAIQSLRRFLVRSGRKS